MILTVMGLIAVVALVAATIWGVRVALRFRAEGDGLGLFMTAGGAVLALLGALFVLALMTSTIEDHPPDGCYRLTTVQRTGVNVVSTGKVTTVVPYTYDDQRYDPIPCP